MTVPAAVSKAGPYTGTGTTPDYTFGFKVFTAADLRVVHTTVGGLDTDLILNTGYTVTLNPDQDATPGGSVHYCIAAVPTNLPVGELLTVVSNLAYDQETDITNGSGFYAQVIEDMVDRTVIQVKQLVEEISRCIKISVSSSADPDDLIEELQADAAAAAASAADAAASAAIAAAVGASQIIKQQFVAGVGYTAGVSTTLQLVGPPLPSTASALNIFFDGAYQQKSEWALNIGTGLITFNVAIPGGVAKVECEWMTPIAIGTPADGTVATAKLADGAVTGVKLNDSVVNDLTTVTAAAADYVMLADASDALKKKKALISDILNLVLTTPPVRQTVLNGPVDANGLPSFGGATGSGTVTTAGSLIATAANGILNRIGSILNASWTGLTTNGTMYLGLTVNADGTCTPFSTTLAPTYRWGGADVVTANQRTFNIQEMQMKVGSGAAAAQAYDVFVGEVTVAGAVVTAITWYALMGRYEAAFTATLPAAGGLTSFNHNIGMKPRVGTLIIENTTIDAGYAVGDQLINPATNSGGGIWPNPVNVTAMTISFTRGSTQSFQCLNKTTGAGVVLTAASWKYKMTADRGW